MLISVKTEIDNVKNYLSSTQKKQIPFAASQALNTLAYKIAKQTMPEKADQTFEGGATPFTKRGFNYKKSTKYDLMANVFVNEAQAKYMYFMVQGGARFPKNKAILVSTRHSRLNQYGNIPRGTLQRMIEDKAKFFNGVPKGLSGANFEGIWERYGRQTKQGGQRIRMVAKYTNKAQYKPLFPFGEFTQGVVFSRNDGFAKLFIKNLERALATAK